MFIWLMLICTYLLFESTNCGVGEDVHCDTTGIGCILYHHSQAA